MKKHKEIFLRIFSLLLIFVMLLGVTITANAATITKSEKSYDIAVVFDNSGSMYQNQGWCRAKYAMEIFASMLNYDKDKLHIFPMWEVTTDGSKPKSGGSYAAVDIKSKKDIAKISNLYTVKPSNTPFAPITEAHEYLKTSTADEKWLIILTDGAFNQEARNKAASIDLQNRVSSLASASIKVQYLGFGGATALTPNEANNFFAEKSSDTSLKDDLIRICNSIFQRSVLPANRLSGNSLNLDLSMKNVIVFAQGADAKITSLKNSDGKEIKVTLDSGQRKYSEIKAGNYDNAPLDTSLAGQVVTFSACPKGEYTLNYSGADAIEIFYEPDVDIDVKLTNSDGEPVGKDDEFVAGEYTVVSRIVDGTTGEDVTNHELMGNDVKLRTFVKTSKDSDYTEYENGAKINFIPDDETEIYIEGEYLGKYKITSKDDHSLDWLKHIRFGNLESDFKVKADVLQSGSWYKISKHGEWKPIRVTLSLKGKPLSDEQLKASEFTVSNAENLKYRLEPVLGQSAYDVYIAQDENGEFVKPDTGKYNLKFKAKYTDEFGKETYASDNAGFEIQIYSKIWRILLWIIIALVIFAIWLAFMLQKVLPKNIRKNTASFTTISSGELDGSFVDLEYRRKGKSLSISGSTAVEYDEQCSATFDLRALDNRFTPSKNRRVAVIGIDSPCEELKIGGHSYVNYNGQWIKKTSLKAAEDGKTVPPIDQELSCSQRFELSRKGGLSTLNCKMQTTK